MRERTLTSDLLRNGWLTLLNRGRLLRNPKLGYVVMQVGGGFQERAALPRRRFPLSLLPWPAPPPSIEAFDEALQQLGADPRVIGAVLCIGGLSAGPATIGSLRQAVLRLRQSGKEVVAHTQDLDLWSYYLACACDRIVAPECASFQASGLWSETLFLRDTLSLAGIEVDFEAIAEYKVSPDTFRRSTMTEPHREMLEALLDSIYGEVVGAIAAARHMSADQVRNLLDSVPLSAEQARDAGLIDAVAYEDELPSLLGTQTTPATLTGWERVSGRLIRAPRWRSRRSIGVISLEGLIVPGTSHRPPVPLPLPLPIPPEQAGSQTVIQQLRAAARDRRLAAVVLYVDSPGGSAAASDLVWREVALLRRTKPVVVYMGDRAASGGYYVSAPANAIIAQPTTLTGSIGIWGGKIVTEGLVRKLRAGREVVSRGHAAGLYADVALFTDEERARIRADLGAAYARFRSRVAQGRSIAEEQVEAVGRGRVWTGQQALERGLVDGLGDLHVAAARARELAELDPRRHAPVVNVRSPGQHQLPLPRTDIEDWLGGLAALMREGVWALAPWLIRIRG